MGRIAWMIVCCWSLASCTISLMHQDESSKSGDGSDELMCTYIVEGAGEELVQF